jgi:hypothetical protein
MILELAAGSLLAADFVYHRWWEDHPKDWSRYGDSIDIPQTEEGTPIPLIYGRVRVDRPILAWMGTPEAFESDFGGQPFISYAASMFFVIGVPFANGNSTNRIHRVWQGDTEYLNGGSPLAFGQVALDQLQGDGGLEENNRLALIIYVAKAVNGTTTTIDDPVTAYSAGAVEFLNGNPNQRLADDSSPYKVTTRAGERMCSNDRRTVAFSDDAIEAVDTGTNTVTMTGHVYKTGDGPFDSNETMGTWPAGSDIYAVKIDANTVGWAFTVANAFNGVLIALTGTEVGATISSNADTKRCFSIFPEDVKGYRGVLSALLYGVDGIFANTSNFVWGLTPQLGAFSFEISSYKTDGGFPATGVLARLGDDSNPINVFYDIWTDPRKLGLSASLLDMDSLVDAAATCYQEDLGCSFCFDQRMPARDMLKEIMRHVDGVYFEDTKTGKIKINLIRANYDYRSLYEINESNCSDLQNLAIGGLADVPNKIEVLYKDRSKGYIDATASDQNMANAVGQDGVERKEQRAYAGCTYQAQAAAFASRDLAFLSQSTIKFRALMDRSAIDLEPGQAVRVSYPRYNISGLVFRVAGPPYHGKLSDGRIAIDCIIDSNYQYRAFPPQPPVPHPDIGRGLVLGFGMR